MSNADVALISRTASAVSMPSTFALPHSGSYLSFTHSQGDALDMDIAVGSRTLHDNGLVSGDCSLPRSGNRLARRLREFIPEHKKDGDYWIKRLKNNEAAKRSREKRRINDVIMSQHIIELTKENWRLRMELEAIRRAFESPPPPLLVLDKTVDGDFSAGHVAQRGSGSLRSSVGDSDPLLITSSSPVVCISGVASYLPSRCDLRLTNASLSVGTPLSIKFKDGRAASFPASGCLSTSEYSDLRLEKELFQEKQQGRPIAREDERSTLICVTDVVPCARSLEEHNAVKTLPVNQCVLKSKESTTGRFYGDMCLVNAKEVDRFRATSGAGQAEEFYVQENAAVLDHDSWLRQELDGGRDEASVFLSGVSSDDDDDEKSLTRRVYYFRPTSDKPLNLSVRSISVLSKCGQNSDAGVERREFSRKHNSNIQPQTGTPNMMTSDLHQTASPSAHSFQVNRSCPSASKFQPNFNDKAELAECKGTTVFGSVPRPASFLQRDPGVTKCEISNVQHDLEKLHEMVGQQETCPPSPFLGERFSSRPELLTYFPSHPRVLVKDGKSQSQFQLDDTAVGFIPSKLWSKQSSSLTRDLPESGRKEKSQVDSYCHSNLWN